MSVARTARTRRATKPITAARHRRVSTAQTRISAGWILIAVPMAALSPSRSGVVHPPPTDRERQEQQRPDLPELDGVHEWPRQTREEHDQPLDGSGHRQDRHANEEGRQDDGDPQPRGNGRVEEAEGQDERQEQRRVVEQPPPLDGLEAHVVQRLAVEHPPSPRRDRPGSRSRVCRRRRRASRPRTGRH